MPVLDSATTDATGLSRGGSRSNLPNNVFARLDATGLSRGVSRWPDAESKVTIHGTSPWHSRQQQVFHVDCNHNNPRDKRVVLVVQQIQAR
jgi:hypothetical protein